MTAKGSNQPEYTEDQVTAFLEMAKLEGIPATVRELGYPTYRTGLRWAKARGVSINQSEIMQKARDAHTFYQTEDLVQTTDEIIERIKHDLVGKKDIDADSVNKLVNAFTKVVATRQTLEGKAASISETRSGGSEVDNHIADLINQFKTNERETTSSSDPSI